MMYLIACVVLALVGTSRSSSFDGQQGLSDALLREMVARMGNDLVDPEQDYLDLPPHRLSLALPEGISARRMSGVPSAIDYDELGTSPSLRDREYIAHSSLLGTMPDHFAAEILQNTLQRFKPTDTGAKTATDLKKYGTLPAYCNPPNPCPMGYTAEDGCLEEFENTAGFSRDFQAMQECICDKEHMFQCSDSTRNSEISALARLIQNEGAMDSTLDRIMSHFNMPGPVLVSKNDHLTPKNTNPFLKGEKLPIAAKKGNMW